MKLRIYLILLCALMLGACGSTSEVLKSPARMQAELAHRNALQAIRDGRIESAESDWHSALLAYQAIDDWSGQGMARLGLAQVQQRLGRVGAAEQVLAPLFEVQSFPVGLRSQAALQMAQLRLQVDSPDFARAKDDLRRARAECTQPCAIMMQIFNVTAKIALREGDLLAAKAAAQQSLGFAQSNRAELAFAQRILAEVSFKQGDFTGARVWLEQAIVLDRQSAEPLWLLDDYRLMLEVAKQAGDLALQQRTVQHLDSLCAAMACTP